MDANLKKLADKLGIATSFCATGLKQQNYNISDKTIKFFISAMGYKANTDKQISDSINEVENKRWRQPLEPIYICNRDNIKIDVVSADLSNIKIAATDCHNQKKDLDFEYLGNAESKGLFYKEFLRITTPLEIGYWDIEVTLSNKKYQSRLAVCPDKCYDIANKDKKIWGYTIQLYSLKSKHNWGIGDFTDLREFVKICAKDGADIIGINPLNVLSHDYPENASPYQSISREFLNPIYIDVEEVPEFSISDKKELGPILNELRSSDYINYNKVYPLKVQMLKRCFERFLKNNNAQRKKSYDEFCSCKGKALDNLAAFQALYEEQTKLVWGGWRAWPQEYKNPDSEAVKKYVKANQERVDFFKFMQFEADRQFANVNDEIKRNGLRIGLYRDLAVGVGCDSAEYWSSPDLFIKDAGTGAPPDIFFTAGQKWGLGTFLPQVLKDKKYAPFIRILRANMQNAGALRIDHVMSLMRLYVIPDSSDEGTYLYYNFADMLNLVALESYLNKCVIVGESIGNVPEGFLEALEAKNIHSLSILWAERWDCGWGDFKHPYDYPVNAFASLATHDLAPLKMWWFGYDIELSRSLGLIPDDKAKQESYHKREQDRQKLLQAFDNAGVWPEDRQRSGNYIYGEKYPEGIEEAAERFMSKTSSPVFLAQLEDILHVEKMQNLPGTDIDKHPNWRLKMPVDLENLASDIAYKRCVAAIRKER